MGLRLGCVFVFLRYGLCNIVKLRMRSSVKSPDVYESSNSKLD